MRENLNDFLKKFIQHILPDNLIKEKVEIDNGFLIIQDKKYDIKNKNIHIVGSGKASVFMGKGLIEKLGDKIAGGIIISNFPYQLDKIEVVVGSHPYPDEKSVNCTLRLINYIKNLDKDDFIIYLLSGGTSALLELPDEELSITELNDITKKLMNLGLSIYELNSIRKRLSKVKGGKLLKFVKSDIVALVLSDVVNDKLEFIGSAPLYPSIDDISKILEKYNLKDLFNEKIYNLLLHDEKLDLLPPAHHIIGNNKEALIFAKNFFESKGLNTIILTSYYQKDAETLGALFAGIYKNILADGFPAKRPVAILAGGESTVNVKGQGKGGRNQHLVLSFLNSVEYFDKNSLFFSFGTDGIDGPTDAAGAFIDYEVYKEAVKQDLDTEQFLINSNSYNFFNKIDGLIKTGATGTNVCDITCLIVL
ncbi:DUF4147 domain-containing protein [Deferribacter thermophilus]|uniref:glycerate kinase type-2 family protein n=1 Tax=Deferribacter thermophilus TaxID=53573 RepID=UPI003C1FC34D